MSYISNYGEFIGILIWFLGGIDRDRFKFCVNVKN